MWNQILAVPFTLSRSLLRPNPFNYKYCRVSDRSQNGGREQVIFIFALFQSLFVYVCPFWEETSVQSQLKTDFSSNRGQFKRVDRLAYNCFLCFISGDELFMLAKQCTKSISAWSKFEKQRKNAEVRKCFVHTKATKHSMLEFIVIIRLIRMGVAIQIPKSML